MKIPSVAYVRADNCPALAPPQCMPLIVHVVAST